jgi:hypothetical protein
MQWFGRRPLPQEATIGLRAIADVRHVESNGNVEEAIEVAQSQRGVYRPVFKSRLRRVGAGAMQAFGKPLLGCERPEGGCWMRSLNAVVWA